MDEGAPHTDRVELRDGRVVLVAPLHVDDRERFVSGIGRASPESLYKRFMTPVKRLSEVQLRYLLDVDHRDHEALLAVDEDSGLAVGIARFVRDRERPNVAEGAILVVDDWQGVGLGKALGRLLADRARALGIERFDAWLLSDNRAMLAVLESLGPLREVGRDGATVRVEVELPERGIGEHMTGILRAVATGDFKLAPKPGDDGGG
ncbi:MAG TPA: GNAT family N-acetyltransferase [Solirubrobacterales bacterium]